MNDDRGPEPRDGHPCDESLPCHVAPLILAVVAPLRSARADEPGAEFSRGAARAFDEQVAPVLARHCLECHGETIRKGGLSLATEDAARKGGDSGPADRAGRAGRRASCGSTSTPAPCRRAGRG